MNLVNFLSWIILGIPLMLTYTTIDMSFWVGIDSNKHFYRFYLTCIVFAFISGISMVTWSSKYELDDEDESDLVTIGIILLVGFSILWVPMFKQSKIDSNYKYATISALTGAFAGAAILAHTVLYPHVYDTEDSEKYSELWAIPAIFLVFQTGIMDFIVWNYFYLK